MSIFRFYQCDCSGVSNPRPPDYQTDVLPPDQAAPPEILEFGNHGNNKKCIKPIVILIKKVLIMILVFGQVFRTNVVSMAIQSYNQL